MAGGAAISISLVSDQKLQRHPPREIRRNGTTLARIAGTNWISLGMKPWRKP